MDNWVTGKDDITDILLIKMVKIKAFYFLI